MIKKIVFCICFSMTLIYAYGLRNLNVGDKLPVTEFTKVFQTANNKLILVGNSKKTKTYTYLKDVVKAIGENNNIQLFFVDTNSKFGENVKQIFDSYKGEKNYITDSDKTIFGQLGVIVLPTLLYVNKDNVLHSYVSGKKHDLALLIAEDLKAMETGKKAGNIYKEFNEKKAEKKFMQKHNQAFKMYINGDYALAASIFKKLNNEKLSDDSALGYIYSLLLDDRVDEALAFFSGLSEEKRKENRMSFANALINVVKNPGKQQYEAIADSCHYETKYFSVIFFAGELLNKQGEKELSSTVYKQAYKVLWNTYRRHR